PSTGTAFRINVPPPSPSLARDEISPAAPPARIQCPRTSRDSPPPISARELRADFPARAPSASPAATSLATPANNKFPAESKSPATVAPSAENDTFSDAPRARAAIVPIRRLFSPPQISFRPNPPDIFLPARSSIPRGPANSSANRAPNPHPLTPAHSRAASREQSNPRLHSPFHLPLSPPLFSIASRWLRVSAAAEASASASAENPAPPTPSTAACADIPRAIDSPHPQSPPDSRSNSQAAALRTLPHFRRARFPPPRNRARPLAVAVPLPNPRDKHSFPQASQSRFSAGP